MDCSREICKLILNLFILCLTIYLAFDILQEEHSRKKKQRAEEDVECSLSCDESDEFKESIDLSILYLQKNTPFTKITGDGRIRVSVIRLLLFKHLLKQEKNETTSFRRK